MSFSAKIEIDQLKQYFMWQYKYETIYVLFNTAINN